MPVVLILASASPRRRELLTQAGVAFEVVPSEVPEVPRPGEPAEAFARRVAREKAVDVARRHPHASVLGADTVVVIDDCILGKPRDPADARRMLRLLSGRTHRVLTAVALIDPGGAVDELLVASEVDFHEITAAAIESYLSTAEPFDKAGAYAVQGAGGTFVARMRGSLSNVIGLPMEAVTELLRRRVPSALNGAGA